MHVTFRIINSFEHKVVFYVPIQVKNDTKISEVIIKIKEKIQADGKYRPIRGKLEKFDTIRLYSLKQQAKTQNLVYDANIGKNIILHANLDKTIEELGFEDESEISYFNIEYWIPLKHQCNNINMCAMRIQFDSQEQKKKIISILTYLITADLPFIQPVFEYFVLQDEIIVICLQPSELLEYKLMHGYARTEGMQIQICYYVIMAILMLHRHRIPIGKLSLRDFVVFNGQYICLSVQSLIKVMNCPDWNAKQDIILLLQVLIQIIDSTNDSVIQLVQMTECDKCGQQHPEMSGLKQLLMYFQMKKNKNIVDEFCMVMLQLFNWKIAYEGSFLRTMALSPYQDDSKQIFRAWPCVNIVIKQNMLSSLKAEIEIGDQETDHINKQIKQLCKFFSAKYKCNRQFIEEILGGKKDFNSFQENETNVMEERETLEEFIQQLPISEYIESKTTIVLSQQTKTNLNLQSVKYTVLHVNQDIDQNTLQQFDEGLNKCLKSAIDGTQMEVIVLLKIKLNQAGIRFVQSSDTFPMDYISVIPLVDIKNLSYNQTCFNIYNGSQAESVLKQLQNYHDYINSMFKNDSLNNIETLIYYFLVYGQVFIQQIVCVLLQERLIKQQESIKSVQNVLSDFSNRQLINEQYDGLYDEIKIQHLKIKNSEKYHLEDYITRILDCLQAMFQILFQNVLSEKFVDKQDLFTIQQQYSKIYTQTLIQQFGSTFLALNDLATCCYILQVINSGSITRIKPCFIFNFKRSESKQHNTQKQLQGQFNYFFMFQIIIMMTNNLMLKEALLLNLLAPDIYLYATPNIQSQFIINGLLKNDYHEDMSLPQQYIMCDCYKSLQRCQRCQQFNNQLAIELGKRQKYLQNQQINVIVKQLNVLLSLEFHEMSQNNSQQFQQILYYYVKINNNDLDQFIEDVFKDEHYQYLISTINNLINDNKQLSNTSVETHVSETLEISDLVPSLSYFKQAIYDLLTPTIIKSIAKESNTDVYAYMLKLSQTLKGHDKYLIIQSYVKMIHAMTQEQYDRVVKLKSMSVQQIQQQLGLDDKEKTIEQLLFIIIGTEKSLISDIINVPTELFSNLEQFVTSPRQLPLQQYPNPSMDFVIMYCHVSFVLKQIIKIVCNMYYDIYKQSGDKEMSQQEILGIQKQQAMQILEKRLQQEQQIINNLTLRINLIDDEISINGCQLLQQSICQFIVAQNMFKRLCILEMIHIQLYHMPFQQVCNNYCNLILTLRNQYDDIRNQTCPVLFKNINNQMLHTIQESEVNANGNDESHRSSDPLTTQQLTTVNKANQSEALNLSRSITNSQLATRLNILDYQDLNRTVQPIISLLGLQFFASYAAVLAELSYSDGFYTEEMSPPFRVIEETIEPLFNQSRRGMQSSNLLLSQQNQQNGKTSKVSKTIQIPHQISADILIMLRNCSKIQQIKWTEVRSCRWIGRLLNNNLQQPYDLYIFYVIQQIVLTQNKSEIVMDEITSYLLPELINFIVSSREARKGDYATLQIILYFIMKNDVKHGSKDMSKNAVDVLPKNVKSSLAQLYVSIFNQTNSEQLEIRLNVLLIMLQHNIFNGFLEAKGPEKLIQLLKTQMNNCRTLILQAISLSIMIDVQVLERYQALNTLQLLRRVPLDKSNKDGIHALNSALKHLKLHRRQGENDTDA